MIRRDFMKMLAGLPFLGFLKEKDEPKGLTLAQLMEIKRKIDVDFQMFSHSLNGNTTYWVHWPDGRVERY